MTITFTGPLKSTLVSWIFYEAYNDQLTRKFISFRRPPLSLANCLLFSNFIDRGASEPRWDEQKRRQKCPSPDSLNYLPHKLLHIRDKDARTWKQSYFIPILHFLCIRHLKMDSFLSHVVGQSYDFVRICHRTAYLIGNYTSPADWA